MTNISVKAPVRVRCPYCHDFAKFMPSSESVYHGRNFGPIFICTKDQAWVGAHRESMQPLGRLANAELRALKIQVHTLFDPLWRDLRPAYPDMSVIPRFMNKKARGRAYRWMAYHLNMRQEKCHIGLFDPETAKRAIELIESTKADSAKVRDWIKDFDETGISQ